MAFVRQPVSDGWRWRLSDSNGNETADSLPLRQWRQASSFPSVIYSELLHHGLIPDPNIGENERLVQWAGDADWEYSCLFRATSAVSRQACLELVFEGLDTFCTVWLNGSQILVSDNMFLPHRVDVRRLLKDENELRLVFESTPKKSTELEHRYGPRKGPMSIMRDPRANLVRKARYHWGWDWGPKLLTSGPYMPISLEAYDVRIDDVFITSKQRTPESDSSQITLQVTPAGQRASDLRLVANFYDPTGKFINTFFRAAVDNDSETLEVEIQSPQLWWPNGQGAQPLYSVDVQILDQEGNLLDSCKKRFGIRTITLIQRPLTSAEGKTFLFNVNGRDIFVQGGNWIPADMHLPQITRERYFSWVGLAKESHLNMIRVWGGGLYETEDFYDACDELGMLVWQDYAFACGDYPIHKEFLDSISAEARAQTRRLRGRTSLALLCGGNEDFMINDLFGVPYDHDDVTGPFDDKPFPQRKIYLDILPKIASEIAPNVQYWASSPWGGTTANDPTQGDIHQWRVWHADQLSYQKYKDLSGRFVSEFGMHSFPVQRTVDTFAPDPLDRYPQSKVIDCHNKGHGAETRIARYLSENFRYSLEFEDFVYCTQLLQSEALGYALRDWKRKFAGHGREECAGAIIWQLNDVYPATSWAYVDYYLRPKPAFYTIKRSFAPLSIGVERTPRSLFIDEDKPLPSYVPSFEVFAHNMTNAEVCCHLRIRIYDMMKRKWLENGDNQDCAVTLTPHYNNEISKIERDEDWDEGALLVLEACLFDSDGKVLARVVDWPEPFRYLRWEEDTKVDVAVEAGPPESTWENTVTVVANHPVKGCWLEPVYDGTEPEAGREPTWSDNMLDLMPGTPIYLGVTGLGGRELRVRFLGDWEINADKN